MLDFNNIYYLVILCSAVAVNCDTGIKNGNVRFPESFEFGVATSAYQIEGAWNVDGKGWSIWDHFVRTNASAIEDCTNGDITTNSYYLYKRDVEMLKELGVANYRLSISWSRILPDGRPSYINPLGIAYYNAVIDELLANNITPYVTIYHWDLPQALSKQNGWLNEDIVDWLGDYARILYKHFGDRVKNWMTINEPYIHCMYAYGSGKFPPLIRSPGIGYYECGRNVLLAHARAYHIYKEEFQKEQKGRIGLVIDMAWPIPETDSEEDIQAAFDYRTFRTDHYLHPVFSKNGNYPERLMELVAKASSDQRLAASRLRPFNEEQIEYIKGSADFLGVNHYIVEVVYRNASVSGMYDVPSMEDDLNVGKYARSSWPLNGREYAPGFYALLIYLKDSYPDITVYITENGCSLSTGLNDDGRVQYLRNYLTALNVALAEGANIKGYFMWSLMDNFEWTHGFQSRFGLYEVDFNDENRTRTPRKSALVYKEIISSKEIDPSYEPKLNSNKASGVLVSILTIGFSVFIFAFMPLR